MSQGLMLSRAAETSAYLTGIALWRHLYLSGETVQAMRGVGMTEEEIWAVLRTLSAILHLGTVRSHGCALPTGRVRGGARGNE